MTEDKKRGFAAIDAAKQRKIAARGGVGVPPEKRSYSADRNLAAEAGRKGGKSVPPEKRTFSYNKEMASKAGRKGGLAKKQNREKKH